MHYFEFSILLKIITLFLFGLFLTFDGIFNCKRFYCGHPLCCFLVCYLGTSTLEGSLALSYEIKHMFTIQSSNHLLDVNPTEMQTYIHIETCSQIFIVALFIISKTGE